MTIKGIKLEGRKEGSEAKVMAKENWESEGREMDFVQALIQL